MLNKEKNLTKSAYYTFNDAVNEIFFSGKFAHKLVYLDFEDVVSNELARRLNIPSNDLSAYIGKAVSDNLCITGNPYKKYIKTLNFWYANEFEIELPQPLKQVQYMKLTDINLPLSLIHI